MAIVRIKNEWFEICMRDPNHPYHNKQCDKDCPHWDLCFQGEIIEEEMFLIVDTKSIEELNKLADELKKRGFEVKFAVR